MWHGSVRSLGIMQMRFAYYKIMHQRSFFYFVIRLFKVGSERWKASPVVRKFPIGKLSSYVLASSTKQWMNVFRVVLFLKKFARGEKSSHVTSESLRILSKKKKRRSAGKTRYTDTNTHKVASDSSVEKEGKSSVTTSKIQALHRIRVTHFAVKWPRIVFPPEKNSRKVRKNSSNEDVKVLLSLGVVFWGPLVYLKSISIKVDPRQRL